jgi:tetratricopeptide (TPR) repeat protein
LYKGNVARIYGSLSWLYLFNEKFEDTINAALAGLNTAPDQEWINTNLALGLLFSGEFEKAKAIYQKYKGEKYNNIKGWTEVFLTDIIELEEKGITHSDFRRVRKILG